MDLPLRRIIVFAKKPEKLAAFYAAAFGLTEVAREEGFVDLASGDMQLAFHLASQTPTASHKLCFFTDDVVAIREHLTSFGAKMNRIQTAAKGLEFCDGRDPEGNRFQISNRA